jgi:hypothetical protein
VDQGEKNRNFSTIGAYFIKRFLNQSGTQTNTSAAHSLGVNPPQEITVTKSWVDILHNSSLKAMKGKWYRHSSEILALMYAPVNHFSYSKAPAKYKKLHLFCEVVTSFF